jgi:hypothetical protein
MTLVKQKQWVQLAHQDRQTVIEEMDLRRPVYLCIAVLPHMQTTVKGIHIYHFEFLCAKTVLASPFPGTVFNLFNYSPLAGVLPKRS